MKAEGETRFFTLSPGETRGPMRWPGTNFRVLETTADFLVKFDESAFLPASVGLPYDTPNGDEFRDVTLRNTGGVEVNATVYAGKILTRDERKVLSGSMNATLIPTAAQPSQFLKVNAAAAPAVPLADVATLFQKATILAKKSLDGTNNVGNVRIGPSNQPNEQPFVLAPGDEITLEPATGQYWNLQDWYLDVDTNNDGVVVIYSGSPDLEDFDDIEHSQDSITFVNNTLLGGPTYFDISQSPSLKTVLFRALQVNSGGIYLQDCPELISVTFEALTTLTAGGSVLWASGCDKLTSFSSPVLATIGNSCDLDLSDCPLLTMVNLASLATIGTSSNVVAYDSPLLANLTLGNFVAGNNATINFFNCALPQSTVDHILARCVASPSFNNGVVDLSGGTTATPSAAGLANKATLIGRGVLVTTN